MKTLGNAGIKPFELELLAPAKNKSHAVAAVDFGADAVYIGAARFGARAEAGNSLDDIKSVVDYAHFFNVKVYVTVNTLLYDSELEEARQLIKNLYDIGVDALIIQDMGILNLDLPPIRLFASTQCCADSLEKVKFLENAGVSRVILPREFSVAEIKKISEAVNIELESFIHGALCVSYSGQCYLSYVNGGRSANRGECAQACRKKYSLTDSSGKIIIKDKYLLSLKDFNASNHLEALANAGIRSFKIEGRLKNESYVKNITAFYRKKIDILLKNGEFKAASDGEVCFDFEPDVNKSFNRGFCDYRLTGVKKSIAAVDSPKSIGEKLGKVLSTDNKSFILPGKSVNPQDGLCFFHNGELSGVKVQKVEGTRIYPAKMTGICKNTLIFRNFDAAFEKKLKNSRTKRTISVICRIFQTPVGLKFEMSDTNHNTAEYLLSTEFEAARDLAQMRNNLELQMKKTADSNFKVADVEISADNLPFLKISEINEIKRLLIKDLNQKRAQSYVLEEVTRVNIEAPFKKELNYLANVINESARGFYEANGAIVSEYGLESGKTCSKDKVLMTCHHCVLGAFNLCGKSSKFKHPLYLKDEKGAKYLIQFNCKTCLMKIIHLM